MRNNLLYLVAACLAMGQTVVAQTYSVSSPDKNIVLTIDNGQQLNYSLSLEGDVMIAPSPMGFEFFIVCATLTIRTEGGQKYCSTHHVESIGHIP